MFLCPNWPDWVLGCTWWLYFELLSVCFLYIVFYFSDYYTYWLLFSWIDSSPSVLHNSLSYSITRFPYYKPYHLNIIITYSTISTIIYPNIYWSIIIVVILAILWNPSLRHLPCLLRKPPLNLLYIITLP